MKVLITGGAGHVGSILRSALEVHHECFYLDLRPVPGAEDRTVLGDITDEKTVQRAVQGMEAAIQLVMANPAVPENLISRSYDVHVKGMHVLLDAAVRAGVRRIIYASSMSVYQNAAQYRASEEEPPDATDIYGLTKRLGEEVCRAFARRHPELSILALRMVLPQTEAQWREHLQRGTRTDFMTGPNDLRRLYLAALALEGHRGFDAVQACSDLSGRHLNMEKARRLLGWEPRGE
ncbi:MAG: hypothetical protein KatS3mg115_2418 [Candidatus Poribacteria bacterium]|nr:MAG: hypothetical protein KatS3mg115_2418 [Candidatus Poribacteria bacterium]